MVTSSGNKTDSIAEFFVLFVIRKALNTQLLTFKESDHQWSHHSTVS